MIQVSLLGLLLTYDGLLWGSGWSERHPTITGIFHAAKSLLTHTDVPSSTGSTLRQGDVILRDENKS